MKTVTAENVLRIINNTEKFEISMEQLDVNLTDIGMDSIAFIQIIVGLEETFDCEFPDAKLLITEMDTAQKMIDALKELYSQHNM